MGCFYHFCPCQEVRPSLREEVTQRGSKKRQLDALRRHYIQERLQCHGMVQLVETVQNKQYF